MKKELTRKRPFIHRDERSFRGTTLIFSIEDESSGGSELAVPSNRVVSSRIPSSPSQRLRHYFTKHATFVVPSKSGLNLSND